MESSVTCDSAQDLLNVEYYLEWVMDCAAERPASRSRWIEVPEGFAARPFERDLDDRSSLGQID